MAVTIKGFGSDWSVPTPAKSKLDTLYRGRGHNDIDIATRATLAAGTLVDPANNVTPWSKFVLNSTTIAVGPDVDPEVGRYLRVTPGPTGASNRVARAVNLDLSTKFVSVPIRVNGAGLTKLELLLGSRTTTLSQSIQIGGANLNSTDLVSGRWNLLTFDPTTAFRAAGAVIADDNDIKDLGWIFATSDGTTTLDFGQIRVHDKGNMRGRVIWQFDDGRKDTYTTAFPILRDAGFVGSIPVEVDTIGQSNRMTVAELQEVYDAGWEILGHHGQQIPSMTDAEAHAEFQKMKDLNAAHGWDRGSNFFVWPGGVWDAAKEQIALEYFTHLRRVSSMVPNPSPWVTNKYSVPLSYITTGTALDTVKSSFDRAKASGGVVNFVTHSVVEGATGADWHLDRFQAAVAYAREIGLESTTFEAMYGTGI